VASLALSFVLLMAWSTAYSVYSVPYGAMAPDIVPSYDGRTRLMTFRVFFMIAGVLAGSAGAPALVEKLGGGQSAYQMVGLVFGLLVTLTCLLGFVSSGYLPFRPVTGEPAPLSIIQPYRAMISLFDSKPFRLLVGAKLCQLAVLSIMQACAPYFFLYVLRMNTGAIGTYLGVSTLAGVVCLPLLRMVIARFGKKRVYAISLAGYAVGLGSWMLWVPGEPQLFFYLRAAINGVLQVGTLLCVMAMLPDTMEYDRLTTGTERAGSMAGAFTLVEQLAGAVGPLVVGLLLSVTGLVQARSGNVVQPQAALDAIQLGMSLIPAALSLVALFVIRHYRLDAAVLAEIRAKQPAAAAESMRHPSTNSASSKLAAM
jgi:GPH family glycoside/pentoside/hexuronide:cation symporter